MKIIEELRIGRNLFICKSCTISYSKCISWYVTGSLTGSETIIGEFCHWHYFIYNKYVRLWNSTNVTEVLTIRINESQPCFNNILTRLPWGWWLVGHLGFKHVLVAECRITGWSALPHNRVSEIVSKSKSWSVMTPQNWPFRFSRAHLASYLVEVLQCQFGCF